MHRRLAVVLALVIAGPVAAGRDKDVTITQQVGPEEIERLAQVLREYQVRRAALALANDNKLRDAVREYMRRFPNQPPQQVIAELKNTYPTLPPADQEKLAGMVQDERKAVQARRDAVAAREPNPNPDPTAQPRPKENTPAAPPTAPPPKQAAPPPGQASLETAPIPPPHGVTADQAKQFGTVTGWWQKNVGPLSETPAVQDVMTDVIKAATPASGQGPLSDLFSSGDAPDRPDAGDWFERNLSVGGFKLSDLGSLNWGGGGGIDGSVPGGGAAFAGGSLLVPLLAAAALGLGWYFWRQAPARRARRRAASRVGLGPWPVDPRRLATREELIRAFEYLSLKTLGPAAAHAHHVALTDGLRDRHPRAADAAGELGALYAVARYAPADDPFPAGGLPAARAAFGRLGEGPA